MRSEAYKLTGFTAVISALGFLIRWLQGMQIIDPDTGLATPGAGISVVMVLFLCLTAAALALMTRRLGRYDLPTEPERAMAQSSVIARWICLAAAALIAVSGLILLVHTPEQTVMGQMFVNRLCGLGCLCGAAGTLLLTLWADQPQRASGRCVASALLIVFGCLWLVNVYKIVTTDPVIWRFVVEILAICAALLAFYYAEGYQFGEPAPRRTIFCSCYGAMLCVMSAVDQHSLADGILYVAVAALLLAWSFLLVLNLRPRSAAEQPAAEPPMAEADGTV